MQFFAPGAVFLSCKHQKFNRYARTKNARWLALGPIRESLPDKGTGRKTGPGHLRVRLPGKARAKQKEIGTARIVRENPYLCRVFLPQRIALSVFGRNARFRPGVVLFLLIFKNITFCGRSPSFTTKDYCGLGNSGFS